MIRSFACRDTAEAFVRDRTRKFDAIARVAHRKMLMLNRAVSLDDMRYPPGNRLGALRGDLGGRYSVRINDQWRLVFAWREGEAHDVEIMDYLERRPSWPAPRLTRPYTPAKSCWRSS